MTSVDGRITVAFNGEIYNFRQLRRELGSQGTTFQTSGDTEVLLHLYRRDAKDMLRHLDGMFAFAIYDAADSSLLLARDRLGQKPLWYAVADGRIVFGSEAKAILIHPKVNRSLDMLSLQHFLTLGYIPAPRTAWLGVRKLLPGNNLRAQMALTPPERYWSPQPIDLPQSAEQLVERVRLELAKAVEARMVADVPLGALLSGGLDSAIVVALMSQAAGDAGGVRTFTAGFAEGEFDERPEARIVAGHCRTEHTELLVHPAPAAVLDDLVSMYDEPFGDSSALPTWLICQAARQHVTVALAGDGGDEVFGGYDRYRAVHLGATMRPVQYTAVRLAAWVLRPWASHKERSPSRRLVRFADGLTFPPALQYFTYRRLFSPEELARLFSAEFAADEATNLQSTEQWFCELYEQEDLPDETARAQRHDMLTYLPDDLLVKMDIASMATSLEVRAPMLDHRLASLGLSLPVEMKLAGPFGKYGKAVLREAFSDLLPRDVLSRPKRGFGVPLGDWLRGELREPLMETLTDPGLLDRRIFNPKSLAGLINDHLLGRDDHQHRLWALLVLGRWLAQQD